MNTKIFKSINEIKTDEIKLIKEQNDDYEFKIKDYTASCNSNLWECNCPDYIHRGYGQNNAYFCKHILAAIYYIYRGENMKVEKNEVIDRKREIDDICNAVEMLNDAVKILQKPATKNIKLTKNETEARFKKKKIGKVINALTKELIENKNFLKDIHFNKSCNRQRYEDTKTYEVLKKYNL